MIRWSILALAGLLGCASAHDPDQPAVGTFPSVERSTTFGDVLIERYVDGRGTHHRLEASAEDAWKAVAQAYEELAIPVGTIDGRTRQVGNARFSARRNLAGQPLSRFFDCGARVVGATMANTHRLEISIMTRVVAEGEGTSRIQTELHAVAYPVGTSTGPTNCVSRGALEDRLAQAAAQRLVSDEG